MLEMVITGMLLLLMLCAMIAFGLLATRHHWSNELTHTLAIMVVLFMYDLMVGIPLPALILGRIVATCPPLGPWLVFWIVADTTAVVYLYIRYSHIPRMLPPRLQLPPGKALGFVLGAINGYLIYGTLIALVLLAGAHALPGLGPQSSSLAPALLPYLPITGLAPYLKFLLPVAMLGVVLAAARPGRVVPPKL